MNTVRRENITDDNGLAVDWDSLDIVSGEGVRQGSICRYTGYPTLQSLLDTLELERCGGARWAYARDRDDGTRYTFSTGSKSWREH